MELCREFIPEECFKEFERLKGELKERDSSFCVVSVFKKRGFESRDNMREKQELIKLVNQILSLIKAKGVSTLNK